MKVKIDWKLPTEGALSPWESYQVGKLVEMEVYPPINEVRDEYRRMLDEKNLDEQLILYRLRKIDEAANVMGRTKL